jgi:hypothetical protein
MKLPGHFVSALGDGVVKLLCSLLAVSGLPMLSLPLRGQTVAPAPLTVPRAPVVRSSVNPVRVAPQTSFSRPTINPSIATPRVQVPRVPVNVPKINIGPGSYYAGYPYGYVPYNTRFFYPPYNPTRVNPATGQTGVGNFSKPRVATGSLLGSTPRHNFQYDDREVLAVQTALRRLGYYTGSLDGILGPDTQAAIVKYQNANKQAVTGFIDRATLSTLGVISK